MKNALDPATVFALDEDFLLAEVHMDGSRTVGPYQFSGMTFLCCHSGTVTVSINEKQVVVGKSFATVIPPTATVKFEKSESEDGADPRFFVVAISQKYLFDLKLDMGELLGHMKQEKFRLLMKNPCMRLEDEVYGLVRGHLDLISRIARSDVRRKKYHYTLLLSSMLNIVNVAFNQNNELVEVSPILETGGAGPESRGKAVFADFMKLAVDNFERERGIRFYADKMCLTPKYLSKLIKEGCGSSASVIIDNLVIAKAKNLLKHTDCSVKLIAAKLNFSSQSSFNKFFKAKTGMSPLKFRAS